MRICLWLRMRREEKCVKITSLFALLVFGLVSRFNELSLTDTSELKRHFLIAILALNMNFLIGVFIPAIFYVKRNHLRQTVWKAMREKLPFNPDQVVQLNL